MASAPAIERRIVARPVWAAAPVLEVFAAAALAGPCLFLAINRGGMVDDGRTMPVVWVAVCLALWAGSRVRAGETIRVPAMAVLLVAWPAMQLVPLPMAWLERVAPLRAAEIAEFARGGVRLAPTVSLYPFATWRAWLMVAGAVALFLWTRDVCRRTPRAVEWLAAGVLALAIAEAAPAIRQYLLIQLDAAREMGPGSDYVRGTFGNRNLLAAWLEGTYGVALAWTLGPGRSVWDRAVAGSTALVAAAVVAASFSRAGIAVILAETLVLGAVAWRRKPGGWPLAAIGATVVCGALVALSGVAPRYTRAVLAQEGQGRLAMWRDAAQAARRYPVLGAGAGAFQWAFRRSHPYLTEYGIDHPHNEYLEMAVEWGAGTTAALLAAGIWIFVRRARRLARDGGRRATIGLGCLVGAGAIALHAAVDFPLHIPALLCLFALLAGVAAGADRGPPEAAGRRGINTMVVALGGIALAAAACWGESHAEAWDAGSYHRSGSERFEEGKPAEAEAAYQRALERNPYAATVWSDLALAREAANDAAGARAASELALRLDPHLRRIEWAAANLVLRRGDAGEGMRLLESLVAHTIELRRPAWEVAWGSGVEPEAIFERLTGKSAKDRDDYVNYLGERERWDAAADAVVETMGRGGKLEAETLRELFARLFAAGEAGLMRRLWERLKVPGALFANGDLAEPLRGWGLDWAVWPVEGVAVERRKDGGKFRLDVEFRKPQNTAYNAVIHDFAVEPGRMYTLRLEAAAEGIGSSEGVQVDVRSHRRQLAASEAFRRTTGWKTVELRFRPAAGETVCRLRIFRRASATFDNQITGRFSIRGVTVR